MSDVPGGPTPPPPPPPPPPSAMGGPQGTIPPKTLGEILSAAFNLYKANAASLILIVAIVVVPLTFISSLFSGVVFRGTTRCSRRRDRIGVSVSSWRARSSPR